jgi:hypothetical protein
MNDPDECDPIIEAGDDGEVLDRSADGAIECVADGEGMTVHVDPERELGERLAWHAGHRGESPDELLADAIREHLDRGQRTAATVSPCAVRTATSSTARRRPARRSTARPPGISVPRVVRGSKARRRDSLPAFPVRRARLALVCRGRCGRQAV